jgi:hypothetical protein
MERGRAERPRRHPSGRLGPARADALAGLFVSGEETGVANHLTPEELSKELGIDRAEVIRVCVEEAVPIYHRKIHNTLLQAQTAALALTGGRHQQASL